MGYKLEVLARSIIRGYPIMGGPFVIARSIDRQSSPEYAYRTR